MSHKKLNNNSYKVNLIILVVLSLAFLLIGYAHADPNPSNNNHKYIIKLSTNINNISNPELFIKNKFLNLLNNNKNLQKNITEKIKIQNIINNLYTVDLNLELDKSFDQKIKNLNSDPSIQYLVKDRAGYFQPLPDSDFTADVSINHKKQWDEFSAPAGINLESEPFANDGGWKYWVEPESDNRVNSTIVVGVLDTGIEDNSNLSDSITKDSASGDKYFGWNFSADNADLSDETKMYHGTHVAGIIAAHGPLVYGVGIGKLSVKPDIKILPAKIPDASGLFYESKVIKAIYWSIGQHVTGIPDNPYPAKVLNMSFGIDEYKDKEIEHCSQPVQEAIDFATKKGVTIVVAAGNNDAEHDLGSPGGCQGVIRVAATGPSGLRAYYSNYGEGIDFAAPGGDKRVGGSNGGILSTVKTGFSYKNGTSMAAPHVAGLVALIYSLSTDTDKTDRDLTPEYIKNLLSATTHAFGTGDGSTDPEKSCYGKKSCGHGIINANNALAAFIENYHVLISSPSARLLELNDSDCADGLVKPNKMSKIITRPEGQWELDPTTLQCQSREDYIQPKLTLDTSDNKISVTYGKIIYNLTRSFKNCKEIGFDGIGCHKYD